MNKPYFDPGRRNANGGLGQWLINNGDGTETLLPHSGEGATMANKLDVVKQCAANESTLVDGLWAMGNALETLALLGYTPDGDNPITDSDLESLGVTANEFFASITAVTSIVATLTPQVKAAIFRIAKKIA